MKDIISNKFPIPWSMSLAEKSTLIFLLETIKPKVAIEIGTYNGGSLQVLSKYSEKVYAIDISASNRDKRCNQFNNVDYIIGDSKTELDRLVKEINASDAIVEFILIDGDHSTEGVLKDIENALKLIPKQTITILLHDSFNPDCRKGMQRYDYNANPYVSTVALDYISGQFNHDGLKRQMWGGFAYIEMKPSKRTTPLVIEAYQDKLYNIIYRHSLHFYQRIFWFLRPVYRLLKKRSS